MRKLLFLSVLLPLISFSQNTGIGTTTPTEKLDVNGNINVTGTIKANGVDGTANQVLMKNSSGTFVWGDMCEYKNYQIYRFTTSGAAQTFTVPAGVTKVLVELWGGGGKGTTVGGAITGGAGGGGGGYIVGYFTVVPGNTITITVGSGANSTFSSAEFSRADFSTQSLIALGGANATYNAIAGQINPGVGGFYIVFNTTNYIGMRGENGSPAILRYDQISATDFGRSIQYGDGGDAANTIATKGKGGRQFINVTTSTSLSYDTGTNGGEPGGGASADASNNSGGNGRVIVRY